MREAVIIRHGEQSTSANQPVEMAGDSFAISEWQGSGPAQLHIHHADDEAWHILEGTIRFRFAEREVEAQAGTTVFVPAGVAHAYSTDDARYLIILTPRLKALIDELHRTPDPQAHPAVYRKYASELLA